MLINIARDDKNPTINPAVRIIASMSSCVEDMMARKEPPAPTPPLHKSPKISFLRRCWGFINWRLWRSGRVGKSGGNYIDLKICNYFTIGFGDPYAYCISIKNSYLIM